MVISSNQINLSWTPGSQPNAAFGVTGYGIWRAPDVYGSAGTFVLVGTAGAAAISYSDTPGLTAGTKYWYKLEAYVNNAGSPANRSVSSTNQPSPATLIAPSSMVAYWRMDEGTGSNIYDTATGGSVADNGTTSGSPTWLTSSSSHSGNALSLNGASQYVTVNNSSDLNITGSHITLAVWAKSGSTNWNSNDSFISSGSYKFGGLSGAPDIEFQLNLGGTWNAAEFINTSGVTGWDFYVATYDGSTMSIYRDGSLVATQSATGSISSFSGTVYLGQNGASGYLNGSLDEVQIYNARLNDAAIASLYGESPLSVTVTPMNSLSSGSYHVQSYDFGTGGIYQYGDPAQTINFPSPGKYLGSTFIQTSNADNANTSFSMSVTLSTPSTVYILFDNAIPNPPSWLTSEFTNTGQTITNSAARSTPSRSTSPSINRARSRWEPTMATSIAKCTASCLPHSLGTTQTNWCGSST